MTIDIKASGNVNYLIKDYSSITIDESGIYISVMDKTIRFEDVHYITVDNPVEFAALDVWFRDGIVRKV